MTEINLWLRGGTIVDGTGRPAFVGDIGLNGDTIEVVTPPNASPSNTGNDIDCSNHVVTPGFIDIHTHSDVSFLNDTQSDSKVAQGVTTEVVGNCGFSAYPVVPHRRQVLADFLQALGAPEVDLPWQDFDGYAKAIELCQPLVNIAPLVGHGALRIATAGTKNVPITSDFLTQMTNHLRSALEQGAFGLSTGLTYVPSEFATPHEIQQLAKVVLEYNGLYATHARATGRTFESFDEAIAIGEATGARVQYSHVALNDPRTWGQAADVIQRFQDAVDRGVDVRYDVYPYDASASSLTQYLPAWTQERGEEGLRDLLSDRRGFLQASKDLAKGLFGRIPWDWERVVVSLAGPGDEDLVGRSIADAAASRGHTPEEMCLKLAGRHGNTVQVVLFYRAEDDVSEFIAHPLAIVGSDGSSMTVRAPGKPHPRNFGAHARLLRRYVVEGNQLTLEDAVHKSTLAAAERLGIPDRGSVVAGARADLAVIDLNAVRENGTWENPCQLASGARDVWVNGKQVVSNSTLTGYRSGRVLRATFKSRQSITT